MARLRYGWVEHGLDVDVRDSSNRPRRRVDHAEKSARMNSNEVYAYVFCP
jgi:hypothetical protein